MTVNFNGTNTCSDFIGQFNSESVRVEGTTRYCSSPLAAGDVLYADERKISTSWHPDWSLKTKVAEPKRITTWIYNGQSDPFSGGVASCAPMSAPLPDGKPVAVLCKQVEQATTDANGSQGFAATLDTSMPVRVRSYTYNQYGQVLTVTDPRGYLTTYVYYSDSTSDHRVGDLMTATNAAGHVTTFNRYDGHGRPLQVTDAKGNITTITYDLRQRPLTSTTAGLTTTFEYDAAGQVKKVTLPNGAFTQLSYDAAHRLTGISNASGSSITYTLDALGNRTVEAIRDGSGTLEITISRVFDALGRLQSVTGAAK